MKLWSSIHVSLCDSMEFLPSFQLAVGRTHCLMPAFASDPLGDAKIDLWKRKNEIIGRVTLLDNASRYEQEPKWAHAVAQLVFESSTIDAERMPLASSPEENWQNQWSQPETQSVDPYGFFDKAIINTYASQLRRCNKDKALHECMHLHARIVQLGYARDRFLGNLMVQTYGTCARLEVARAVFEKIPKPNLYSWTIMLVAYSQNGYVDEARSLFSRMPQRNAVTWNAIIAACVQNGQGKEALELFRQMQHEGVEQTQPTFVCILDACISMASLAEGRYIHAHIVNTGFETDIAVGNALVNMYGKCGNLVDAKSVFEKIPQRDVISWNVLISASMNNGCFQDALQTYYRMQIDTIKPDQVTFLSVVDACTSLGSLAEGQNIHTGITNSEFKTDVHVGTALVNMYGKCGSLDKARSVFDKTTERDVVLWSAMISACAQNDYGEEALELFLQMQIEGLKPDMITCVCALGACGSIGALTEGQGIHASIIENKDESNLIVGNTLITMYGKCGSLVDARSVFTEIPRRDCVSWNGMIAACIQNDNSKVALELFVQMQAEGTNPDKVTFIGVLSACASLATLGEAQEVHTTIVHCGFEADVFVGSALVSMYGKCGSPDDAWTVFDKIHHRNVVSWNAMIAAYAQNGHGKKALKLYNEMLSEGIKPDEITFIHIIAACSHTGLTDAGKYFFASMMRDHGLKPLVDHYECMIDLLGRAGQLNEAEEMITGMPAEYVTAAWLNMLSVCRTHGDVERGVHAAHQVLKLDPKKLSPYVLLSNIHAAAGRWDEVANIRRLMKDNCVKKVPGCS